VVFVVSIAAIATKRLVVAGLEDHFWRALVLALSLLPVFDLSASSALQVRQRFVASEAGPLLLIPMTQEGVAPFTPCRSAPD
jgi:hypothetical protein